MFKLEPWSTLTYIVVVFASAAVFGLEEELSEELSFTAVTLSAKYLEATYPSFPFTFIFDQPLDVEETSTLVFTFIFVTTDEEVFGALRTFRVEF